MTGVQTCALPILLEDAEKYAEADQEKRKFAELKATSELMCGEIQKKIENNELDVSEEKLEEIKSMVKEIEEKTSSTSEDYEGLKTAVDKLQGVLPSPVPPM